MNNRILKDKHFLIVEDDEINQLVIQRYLERLPAFVSIASDGKSALELLEKNSFDFILLDIHLPDMSGYELMKNIRLLNTTVPVIAVTALAQDQEKDFCMAAGMNGYISKPFSTDKLVNEILNNFIPVDSTYLSENKTGDQTVHVDIEFLNTVAAGDQEFIQQMVLIFIDNFPEIIADMRRFYEKKDWPSLQKTAHYAKSSLSVIKVTEMLDLILEIENQCKTSTELNLLDQKIEILSNYFASAKKYFESMIQLKVPTML